MCHFRATCRLGYGQKPAQTGVDVAGKRTARPARFGGVRPLTSGRFQARYRRDGRTYTGPDTFGTEEEAWDYLKVVEASMVTGEWRPRERTSPTLAVYGPKWIDVHPKIKPTTAALYRGDFARHVEPYLGHLTLRELSTEVVREWVARLRADLRESAGKSQRSATTRDGSATAARSYRLLRAILATAVKDHKLDANPCNLEGAGDTGKGEGAQERPTLSAAEVALLADKVPDRYRALVLVLAWCGLRIGEACALRRDDIDLTRGAESLRVSERVYYIDNLGWNYDAPKSQAGRRRVPVPAHVAQALAVHLAEHTGPEPGALVFATRTGKTSRRVAGPIITRRLDAMGRDDVRVHDLRHTGQVLAAIAGASQAELMRRMGHSSTLAAQNYAHAVEDHGRAVAEALADVAGGANVVPLKSRRRRTRSA